MRLPISKGRFYQVQEYLRPITRDMGTGRDLPESVIQSAYDLAAGMYAHIDSQDLNELPEIILGSKDTPEEESSFLLESIHNLAAHILISTIRAR